MQKLKRKKLLKGMLLGIGLTGLTVFVLFTLFLWLFFTGGFPTKTKDIKRYQEIFGWQTTSGMLTFPEEIPEGTLETDFYYYYRDTLFSPTYQIYLRCTYEPDTYEKEKARLENIRKVYGGTEKKLLRNEENKYRYPAYIAIENHHNGYEYALLTGKNEITYISTAYVDENKIYFNKDYLPIDYMTDVGRSYKSGYSIYISSISSEAVCYDNTRNESVDVMDAHLEQIQDSYFVVRTKLDNENREIIVECTFDYYESLEDEDCESTVYSDINGMEYKKLALNEDRTKAIVTYYDGNEEREFVVKLPFPEKE